MDLSRVANKMRADFEIFLDGQLRKDASAFRHMRNPIPNDDIGRNIRNFFPFKANVATVRLDQS